MTIENIALRNIIDRLQTEIKELQDKVANLESIIRVTNLDAIAKVNKARFSCEHNWTEAEDSTVGKTLRCTKCQAIKTLKIY